MRQFTEQEITEVKQIIRNAIQREAGVREEEFARARIDHRRGFISEEQLFPYLRSVEFAEKAIELWDKISS